MSAFISHNRADRETARSLATALVAQGESVWFDEWDLRPGDSMTGGIQEGLEGAEVFVLVWSETAARSRWVGAEVRAYVRRRIDDDDLRIIPVMLDETPLPALVANYKGFRLIRGTTLDDMAHEIAGRPADIEIAQVIQRRLLQLTFANVPAGDPLPYLVCPSCGSADLDRRSAYDSAHDKQYFLIDCSKCGWGTWSE